MEEVGRILPAALRRLGRIDKTRVAETLASLWPRVVGKSIAEHSGPVAFEAGTLTLAAVGESWTLELRRLAEELRAEINGFLGVSVVSKLRVERRDAWEPPATTARRPAVLRQPETTPLEPAPGGAALDPEMAGILERSFARYFARQTGKASGWR